MKYRKKPVVIEAFQYEVAFNLFDSPDWILNAIDDKIIFFNCDCFIKTLEGDMKVSIGDYIIKGINGELYPCKPDIFDKTYELVKG